METIKTPKMSISLTKRNDLPLMTLANNTSQIFATRVPFNIKYDKNSTKENIIIQLNPI